jgi:phospholipase C
MALEDIDTIIVVIMENRSFDHMLGYLNLPGPGRIALEGLSSDAGWLADLANPYQGTNYESRPLDPSVQTIVDPNHNWDGVATQIGEQTQGGYAMGGFVQSYATYSQPAPPPADYWHAMGYYDAPAVPTYDFFARHFLTCDHWFCALPAGTQPNRLMAMSGTSSVFENGSSRIQHQDLVYEWLEGHSVSWCSYVWGDFLPFFALDWDRLPGILKSLTLYPGSGQWRHYDHFATSWASGVEMPSVIFIEPEYSEGLASAPNDDHSPTGIEPGQTFLRQIYCDVIANPARWARTMMIVTYDEHGGFFDHVMPLDVPANAGGYPFASTGPRVPAFVISPQVMPGSVFSGPLDHTSILELLAEKFTAGHGYSVPVNARQSSLDRLSQVLNSAQIPVASAPPPPAMATAAPAQAAPPAPLTANGKAFRAAAVQAFKLRPDLVDHPNLAPLARHMREEGLL